MKPKSLKLVNLSRYNLKEYNLDKPFDTQPRQDLKDWLSEKVVSFFPSENNLYAEKLALRAIRSVTHANCLNTRLIYTCGTGFETDDTAFLDYIEGKGVNSYDDSFLDVFKSDIDNANIFGNSYVELVKIAGQIFIYSIDATKVRVAKPPKGELDSKGFYVAPDWTESDEYANAPNKELTPIYYPKFPNFETIKGQKGQRCIAQWKNRKPNFFYYGLPDYVAALNDIDNEFNIGAFNLKDFEKNFEADYLILAYSDTDDEEEAKALKSKIEKDYQGVDAKGAMVQILSQDGKPIELHKIERNTDGRFNELSERVEKNIAQAHQVPQALAGIATAGQLGNVQELKNGYEIYMNNVIKPYQSNKLRWWKKLLTKCKELGATNIPQWPEDLKIMSRKPISFVGLLAPERVLMIDEQREELGRDPLDNNEGKKLLTNGTNNRSASNSDRTNS